MIARHHFSFPICSHQRHRCDRMESSHFNASTRRTTVLVWVRKPKAKDLDFVRFKSSPAASNLAVAHAANCAVRPLQRASDKSCKLLTMKREMGLEAATSSWGS